MTTAVRAGKESYNCFNCESNVVKRDGMSFDAGDGTIVSPSTVESGADRLVIAGGIVRRVQASNDMQYLHPSASAIAVNRPKAKVCDGIEPRRPSRTSASVLHAMVVVAVEPCQFAGLPWSMTIEDTVPPLARDIRSNIDSKSILNSPKPGPLS